MQPRDETEPVAALVEKLMWTLNALVDETWEQDDVEEVSRYLDAIVAAARAEVLDDERLADAVATILGSDSLLTVDGDRWGVGPFAEALANAYRKADR